KNDHLAVANWRIRAHHLANLRPISPANWRAPTNWSISSRQLANLSQESPIASASRRCGHVRSANWRIGGARQQGYLTAYTTRLVTSVVCRGSIPARGDIAIRQPAPEGFSPGAVASLLSHNPADGSVAALPGQTAAKTNYLNQRFLSY
ncbi:hypothetical protein PENSTE_c060G10437, partial [Penicillium steckii]